MRFVFDLVYAAAGIVLGPWVVYRMVREKRYRRGWAHRFGQVSRREPSKKCIWIHAVSVGEVNATRTLVEKLREESGDVEVVISTTTDTGFARASTLYGGEHVVFYFPLDFSFSMLRAFGRIRPSICLLMELEVWPNFVDTAGRLNVPVVVVNGRITERSCSRYRIIRPIAARVFGKVTLVLAQTDEYARRFVEIGVPAEKVVVTGSLKYDTASVGDKVEGADRLAAQLGISKNDRIWVAGGTGNDEEKILIEVYKRLISQERFKDVRLAIIPRKPERFDEVARLMADAGLDFVRFSSIKGADKTISGRPAVILGDTMGDLRKFYSLATVVFVGRSLVPMGGSDMIEAAALGKPCVFGPHAFNFTQTVEALLANQGAVEVKSGVELQSAMEKILSESDFAAQIGRNAQDTIRKGQGATARTVTEIAKLLRCST